MVGLTHRKNWGFVTRTGKTKSRPLWGSTIWESKRAVPLSEISGAEDANENDQQLPTVTKTRKQFQDIIHTKILFTIRINRHCHNNWEWDEPDANAASTSRFVHLQKKYFESNFAITKNHPENSSFAQKFARDPFEHRSNPKLKKPRKQTKIKSNSVTFFWSWKKRMKN